MNRRARSIPVETIQVGDEATFTWESQGVARSSHARVSDIVYHGHVRILHAESGAEIVRYDLRTPRKVQCVIHKYTPVPHTRLF